MPDETESPHSEELEGRPPQGWHETLTANFRPQPAIPSALAFFVSVILPIIVFGVTGASESFFTYLIPLGIVVSAGLAVAAGFCSFFPHSLWLILALWGENLAERGSIPVYNAWFFRVGFVVMLIMIIVQIWRVKTKQFVPTIRDIPENYYE